MTDFTSATLARAMLAFDTHDFRDANHQLISRERVLVPILSIEYRRVGQRHKIVPFAVRTAFEWWDVEWCKRDGQCYYHCSGGGGSGLTCREMTEAARRKRNCLEQETTGRWLKFDGRADISFGRFCDVNASVPIWYDRNLVRVMQNPKGMRDEEKPARNGDEYLRLCGYLPVANPLELGDGILNPFQTDSFQSFGDRQCEYCKICDDWLPDEELCEHVRWCDEHGVFGGPGKDQDDGCPADETCESDAD